jgi:hypothetical protein
VRANDDRLLGRRTAESKAVTEYMIHDVVTKCMVGNGRELASFAAYRIVPTCMDSCAMRRCVGILSWSGGEWGRQAGYLPSSLLISTFPFRRSSYTMQ